MSWGDIDWGDMPTAIAAVFAGLAAWYARKTMVSQRKQIGEQQDFVREQQAFIREQSRTLQLEQAALTAAADDRRSTQARAIGMAVTRMASGETRVEGGTATADTFLVNVSNQSDEPISDVTVKFGQAHFAKSVQVVQGRGHPMHPDSHLLELHSHSSCVFTSPLLSPGAMNTEKPKLYFTDNERVPWTRKEGEGPREAHQL